MRSRLQRAGDAAAGVILVAAVLFMCWSLRLLLTV
jgi:hypothetical protein